MSLQTAGQQTSSSQEIVSFVRDPSIRPSTSRVLPKHRICPTFCFVCGDAASACHYEVPSCHGCRSFFRRTVISQKEFACKRDGKCFNQLSTVSRCYCKACRFKKCIDVGMNPMAIQGENDLQKNELIRRIMRKRESCSGSPEEDKKILSLHVPTIDQQINNLVDGLLYLEIKKDLLRKSAYNPNAWDLPPLDQIVKSGCSLGIGDKIGPMPNWPLAEPPPPPPCSQGGTLLGPPPYHPNRKNWLAFDLLCCVEYAKTFPFFHLLTEKDQLILLKSVTLMTFMLTQAWFSYENKADSIIHPDGTRIRTPRNLSTTKQRDEAGMKKATILPLIRSQVTKKEYVLLKAMLLCNTGLGGLSDHATDLLSRERQRHNEALLKICLVEGGVQGPARYSSILAMIDNLERLADQHRGVHLLMKINNPHRKEIPLIEEIMF